MHINSLVVHVAKSTLVTQERLLSFKHELKIKFDFEYGKHLIEGGH